MTEHFDTFKEVKHNPLKVFNRTVMFHNILEDYGMGPLEDYCDNFNAHERWEIICMTEAIKRHGVDTVRSWVLKGFEPELSDEQVIVN